MQIKNEYIKWLTDIPLGWFLTVEVNKKFVNTHKNGLNKHLRRLFHNVNRSIFGRSYRENGQYLKGFVVMETKNGFHHWHILILPIKDRVIDPYHYIEKALTKVNLSGERVFRKIDKDKNKKHVGVYLEPVDLSRKESLVTYCSKDFNNSDHIMLLGCYGVEDLNDNLIDIKNKNYYLGWKS